jgi:Tol biopolymer transport system component
MRSTRLLAACLAVASAHAVEGQSFTAYPIDGSPATHVRVVLEQRPYGLDLTLLNEGGPNAAVVGLYFDDQAGVLGDAEIIDGNGVEFDLGGSPPELPEGQTLNPPFHTDLYLTAAPPPPHSGVNPGEQLKLRLSLRKGGYKGLLDELMHGRVRVGIRAIGGPGAADMILRGCAADLADRVSITGAEEQGSNGSTLGSTSDDGQVIAFWSKADNLVDGDMNGRSDVFIRNRCANWTVRVSVSTEGFQGNGDSLNGHLSGTGRYVVFSSDAANLVPGDTNGARDVFVRDRYAFTTSRVSVATAGAQSNGASDWPRISADGRFVVFESAASNLVPGDTNGLADVFLRDRALGQTTRLSLTSAGGQANGRCYGAGISDDGLTGVFVSDATNLVHADTNGVSDVFVRDRSMGATARLSLSGTGVQGNGASSGALVSPDGRWIAFTSTASNLVAFDTNGAADVFLKDRLSGITRRESVGPSQANGASRVAGMSSGGRYVMFSSEASNLINGDTNGAWDVFVRDRWEAATRRVSLGCQGQAVWNCGGTGLSRDGRYVVFNSLAGNLVTDDRGFCDVFVVDLR